MNGNLTTNNNESAKLKDVLSHFDIKGSFTGYTALKSGNINKTFAVFTIDEKGKTRTYLLQQINATVFSDPQTISDNIEGVTSYIFNHLPQNSDKKRLVERIFDTKDGKKLYIDNDKCYWRLMSYIYDSVCVNLADAKILESTGKAFGNFLAQLSEYPIETLKETIPDFHNTPKRVRDLKASYEKDVCGRRAEVDEACRYIFAQEYYINFFENAYKDGKLPLRVTHNDTKCNNVLFDAHTYEPLAVIDLDTVMPGFPAYDFGDAIRFGANTCTEDDPNLEKVELDLEKYEAFCRGYISAVKHKLTRFELETLYIGAVTTILEIGARFLADYLDGDVYFICRRDRHNYYRGMNQVKLLRSAISRIDDLRRISFKYID